MPAGVLPEWLLPVAAAGTIFAVMFGLGLAIAPRESAWVAKRPWLLGKALFAVLVAVPALAWIVVRIVDLPRAVEIGIVLMAVAPGAPVALRRSIGAGGHPSFAPALQIAIAAAAVISMPLAIAAFDEYYGGSATIEPRHIARQVLIAQLVPLALGMLVRRVAPQLAGRIAPRIDRVAGGSSPGSSSLRSSTSGPRSPGPARARSRRSSPSPCSRLPPATCWEDPIARRPPQPPSPARCAIPALPSWWRRSTMRRRW